MLNIQPSEALGFFESVDEISDYSGHICTKNSTHFFDHFSEFFI